MDLRPSRDNSLRTPCCSSEQRPPRRCQLGLLQDTRPLVSLLAVVFGLNLLQLVPLQLGLGSLLVDPRGFGGKVPPAARAFVFGASSALVASPCASPVPHCASDARPFFVKH